MYIQTYINMQYLNSPIISYYIHILRKLFTRRRDLRSTPIIPLQNDYQYPGFRSLVPVSTSLGRG